MEIVLHLEKSLEENAGTYFDRAKKLKKKIPGIKDTIALQQKKVQKIEDIQSAIVIKPKLKKEWFDKFRWCISSEGFLMVGGRDATTNEIVIKKHTDAHDIVFHTELPGSPFIVIKTEGKDVSEITLQEAGELCASFSKSWSAGRSSAEVFHITPEQVSKEAKSGEYIPKGAFMIYGKRTFMNVALNTALCNAQGRIMAGPLSAIKSYSEKNNIPYVEIIQGKDKMSDVAKKIARVIGGEVDDIVRALPPDCTLKKIKPIKTRS